LGRTVHFPGNEKGKGSCCGVDFMTFLKFSLKCREGNPCREAASNALTQCFFSTVFKSVICPFEKHMFFFFELIIIKKNELLVGNSIYVFNDIPVNMTYSNYI
jgi:hypothetical protein